MGWKILVIVVIVLVLIFGGPNIFKDSGVAAASGRGIYESVRTDHHEPLGSGGAGEKSGSS